MIGKDQINVLTELFTNKYIEFSEVRCQEKVYPWRKTGIEFSFIFNSLVFYIPLLDLVDRQFIDGIRNKKELAYLYYSINEYLKENPNFIRELIENEKKKVR